MRARPITLSAQASAGRPGGIPSTTDARAFSAALIVSQLSSTSLRRTRLDVGEDVRMAADQLLDDVAGDVVDVERLVGVLSGDPRVEHHLEQQVTELLAQVVAVAGLDRLDRLVGLLDEVAHQRLVRLLAVPGALATQPVHHRDQVEQPRARRVEGTEQISTSGPSWSGS